MEIHNSFRVGRVRLWGDGLPIPDEKKDFALPIHVQVNYFQGYTGAPRELLDTTLPIMSRRLKDVFDSLGIDNIDYYPVLLENITLGINYEYFAFKLIGKIAAVDLAKSEIMTYKNLQPIGDASVYSMAIDEGKARGLMIFRLAEDLSAIMVHDRVVDAIKTANIDTITFAEPKDYMSL